MATEVAAVRSSGKSVGSDAGAERLRFSVEYMNPSADPRKDFYEYAVGRWAASSPMPADRSAWDATAELEEWNASRLRAIAEECASMESLRGSYERMVGDFYTSAMDAGLAERLRFAPIEEMWQRVNGEDSLEALLRLVPELHSWGVHVLFDSDVEADMKNSNVYAISIEQGGLSLPGKDYYLKDSFSSLKGSFRQHVSRMFALRGVPDATAARWADFVLDVETAIANASKDPEELLDPRKNYTRIATSELDSRYRHLNLPGYLKGIGVPSTKYIVVCQPEFLRSLDSRLEELGAERVKAYMLWQLLNEYAPLLHGDVEREDFDFFQRELYGQEKLEARWKVALAAMDNSIGFALGKLYADRHLGSRTRGAVGEMTDDIIAVFRKRFENAAWMSSGARQKALEKLSKLRVKIGHPKIPRDYSGLLIDPHDYVGNVHRAIEFELRRGVSRVGLPVDREEWGETQATANTYYITEKNEIELPAGMLQPPFFDASLDDAVNYGAIGALIAHEVTHGFDSDGRWHDADGNLNNWWTPEDERRFDEQADRIVDAYSSLEAMPGVFVNGRLTLGENIADLGGISIAYEALQMKLAREPSRRATIDGFTPEQRFFISYAQSWRSLIKNGRLMMLLATDEHALDTFRAVLPAVAQGSFDDAFPSKEGETRRRVSGLGIW